MLAISVRVRPWSALCRFSSEGRRTITAPSSTTAVRSAWIVRTSSPLGPVMVTVRSRTAAVTPLGSGTGFLPIRDIVLPLLPDHREQLTAHAGGAGFAVGHDALGRAEDRHAEAVLDPRDLARLDVAAQAGGRHALELPDDGGVVVVLEVEAQQPVTPIVQDLVVLDVVVVAEDPRDLDLQLGHGHVGAAVACEAGVPHARQHVGNGISHAHRAVPLPTGLAHAGDFPA